MADELYIGVIVYDILPDGCLNGLGSDNDKDTKNEIFNEIARKKSDENSDGIAGNYICSYSDTNDVIRKCCLTIGESPKNQFHFHWHKIEGRTWEFIGIGWRIKPNQIAVSYRQSK
jgi:hypothetical protein